jgi:dipeptidyl-peptidase 4
MKSRFSGFAVVAHVVALVLLTTPYRTISQTARQSTAQNLAKSPITIEGIWTGKFRDVSIVPSVQWLQNGTAVLFDTRKPASERTFERLDPASGKRTSLGDAAAIHTGWKAITGSDFVPLLTFTSSGNAGLIEWDADVHVLSVASGTWKTIKGAKEGCTRFSPDGTKVGFVRANDLYVFDIASGTETRLTTGGTATLLNGTHSWVYWEEVFDRDDAGFQWSGDSKMIAYFQSDESPVSIITFPDFKPVVPAIIEQRYPKAGTANPKVRVGVIMIDKPNETRWIDVGAQGYAGVDTASEYIVRMKWLPDGKRLSVQTMNRAQTALVLHFADAATGKATKIFTETNAGWVNQHDDLHFLADGKQFLWASERTGYNHIYRYTMDGKLVNQVTKGSWATGGSRLQAIAAVDEKKGVLYFRALEKSSVERHLYKINLDGSKMQRLTEENGTHSVNISDDGAFYTDTFSTLNTPPNLALYKTEGNGFANRVSVLAPARTDLMQNLNLVPQTLFTIPVPDGFSMPAQMLKPRSFDAAKRYPVVIYVYGGPSAPVVQDAWGDRDKYFYQMLADAGYIIVKFDNRSCAGISKTYENSCLKQLAGDSELNDLLAGVEWLKRQPFVDSARIGMWGWSFGGAFTLQGLTRSSAFKAGIAVAAPSDWRFYDTKYTESFMRTPQENKDGYDKTNANLHAADLHGRLLLVQGTFDDNVHPQNAWTFINELVRANKQFDLMIYPMRKHGIADPPARIHLYNLMFDFWKKNL